MCTTIRITFILYNTRDCKASHNGRNVPAQCCRKFHTIYDTATETFIKHNAVYLYCKQENATVKSWLCSVMGSAAHSRQPSSFEFLTKVFESDFFFSIEFLYSSSDAGKV